MTKQNYTWRGVNRQGEWVSGEISASNLEEVRSSLQQKRIRATRIRRQITAPRWLAISKQKSASMRSITQLTRQLATLLSAGVPLLQSLQILERGEIEPRSQSIVQSLRTEIESGMSLNKALRMHSEFNSFYCNLVAAGEIAGVLDAMLERLANHLEKSERLRATIHSALIYPAAVIGIAVSVLVLILLYVVPAFQKIFTSFNAELPWLTQCVIAASESVQDHGPWLLIASMASVLGLRHLVHRMPSLQLTLHQYLLAMPIAGPLTRHACTARWTRAVCTLFAAGIPLTEALETAQNVTGHLLFQKATRDIHAQLIQGQALSCAIENTHNLFPHWVAQMCAVGEESGTLDQMLEKIAQHYEREVEDTVGRLSTLLEPFIMVILGIFIGVLVMALYLPIFQLGQVV